MSLVTNKITNKTHSLMILGSLVTFSLLGRFVCMAATSKSKAFTCSPRQAQGVRIHACKMAPPPWPTWHSLLEWAIEWLSITKQLSKQKNWWRKPT